MKAGLARVAAVCVLLLLLSRTASALPDELSVQSGEILDPGEAAMELSLRYALARPSQAAENDLRPTFHVLQLTPEFSWGLDGTTQIGLQLFGYANAAGGSGIDGARVNLLALPVRPPTDGGDGLSLGALVEIGRLPHTISSHRLQGDIRAIVAYRSGAWLFAANPEIGAKLAGEGSASAEAGLRLRLARILSDRQSIGVEYYGDAGLARHPSLDRRQSQQLFGVVDYRLRSWELGLGLGRGLTPVSEPWLFKLRIGLSFKN